MIILKVISNDIDPIFLNVYYFMFHFMSSLVTWDVVILVGWLQGYAHYDFHLLPDYMMHIRQQIYKQLRIKNKTHPIQLIMDRLNLSM